MISLWGASSGSKPNLVLDFIGSETLDPRVTFSRASNATRTNAQGLIAYAPHNLELYSQTFANAFWDKAGGLVTVTDNFTTAPDGTTTAAKWTEAAGTGSHHIHDAAGNFTPVVGQAYTMSMYLKQTETNPDRYVQMVFWLAGFPATAYANFDMQTGAIAFRGAGLTSATITPENNGWYRLSISAVATATGASGWQAAFISNATAARAESYTVSAGNEESYYLWGAQVNLGGLVGYTLTTSAVAYGPRFDFDPVTLAPKGLLIEEARTNLLTYSEQFDNATWSKLNTTITANTTTAPDGTATAETIIRATGVAAYLGSSISSAANTYTKSVYAKAKSAGNRLGIRIQGSYPNRIDCIFNLVDGTTTTPLSVGTASAPTASISNLGNGWYRCILTGTLADTLTTTVISPCDTAASTNSFEASSATASDCYIWGAQLEAGSFATSYIPTVASQATRAADNAVMTGTNFSSWYRQDEGTVFVKFDVLATTSDLTQRIIIGSSNGSFNNSMYISRLPASTSSYTDVVVGGVNQVSLMNGVVTGNNIAQTVAFSFKVNDFATSLNGNAIFTDTSGNVPVVTGMTIGDANWVSAANTLNGHIAKLAYYPKRLTNAELQSITTG